MKIAVISSGSANNMKGAFIATHNRIKHLLPYGNLEIDVFLIQAYENFFIRTLRKSSKREKEEFFIYDGIRYNNLWYDFSLVDYLLLMKTKYQGPFYFLSTRKWTKVLKNYEFISAHSYFAGILAFNIYRKYKIPFAVTWHGSDIHSLPASNLSVLKKTKELISNATYNFFVSKNLLEISDKITKNGNKVVLYNGVDTNIFRKYSEKELIQTRKKFSISPQNMNVAYFGGLVLIKNADKLPEIFKHISLSIPNANFFIVGDGKMREKIENDCARLNINVSFLGNHHPSDMPALINCMDLVLLPSKNEGLPLITLESLACGTPVIGSRVGGIVESLGMENTVELDGMFIENFSRLAVTVLSNKRNIKIDPIFDWRETAEIENQLYNKYNTYD